MLTLAQAIKEDRLPEFAAQQEAAGLPPADRRAFEAIVGAAVKPVTAADQTSRSQTGDDSTGKRTRRGTSASSRR